MFYKSPQTSTRLLLSHLNCVAFTMLSKYYVRLPPLKRASGGITYDKILAFCLAECEF